MEMGQALGDVRRRDPKPQIVDRSSQAGSFLVELERVLLLLAGEGDLNGDLDVLVVVLLRVAADDVGGPSEKTRHSLSLSLSIDGGSERESGIKDLDLRAFCTNLLPVKAASMRA